MVVTQVFRRLGKRLDRPRIAAKFDLGINDTSFHRHFPSRDVRSCAGYRPFASGAEAEAQKPAMIFAATRSQITHAMAIANSKRSSASRLESFSHLRGLLRPLVLFSARLGSCRIASAKVR
jgi:hypothetical protein